MHAQPWRLFALGFALLVLIFWFQDSVNKLVALLGEPKTEGLKSGVAFAATTITAMVGAIFGTAITNRIKLLNKKEIEQIMAMMAHAEDCYRKPAEEIYATLIDKTQPLSREKFLQLHSQRTELLVEYHREMSDLKRELRKLSP